MWGYQFQFQVQIKGRDTTLLLLDCQHGLLEWHAEGGDDARLPASLGVFVIYESPQNYPRNESTHQCSMLTLLRLERMVFQE